MAAGTTRVTATATSTAPVEEVWRLLATVETWPDWAPVRSAELERPGAPEPGGAGAVRRFRTPLGTTREEVLEAAAPHRQVYTLLAGLPLDDYRSEVLLTPTGDGTTITWSSTFRPRRGPAWFWRPFMGVTLRSFARALAKGAARA